MKRTYAVIVGGERAVILKVEMQPDETAKILKTIFDTKLGNEAYRQYKMGDFHRLPEGVYTDEKTHN
jgi:hypothetical protein